MLIVALIAAPMSISGCSTFPMLRTQVVFDRQSDREEEAPRETEVRVAGPVEQAKPAPQASPIAPATMESINALLPEKRVNVALPSQPLGQFIDTVFGQVLGVPYVAGPNVGERRDLIALRGAVETSQRGLFTMVQAALADYGLIVGIENGTVRIAEDPVLMANAPVFTRARAFPETPVGSRPVVQFLELSAMDVKSILPLIEAMFPSRNAVRITPREDINALVLSGNARDVTAAAALIAQLDKPRFADGQIARVRPINWPAAQLSQAIANALAQEGYRASAEKDAQTAILFQPVMFSNDLLMFSNDPVALQRAVYWAQDFDRAPPAGMGQDGAFIYEARNTSAAALGELVARSLGPGERDASAAAPTNERASLNARRMGEARTSGRDDTRPAALGDGRITIDPGGNRILFNGTAAEFETVRRLLTQLDTPPRQVLVELTIAEVTLTDETRFGVEWFLQEQFSTGTLTIDTRGAAPRQPGGIGATFARAYSRGQIQTALTALATNRNLNILSTPRLSAVSGGEAEILVGTDVPIITSQRAGGSQSGGTTDILQTVQYRQTGVILNIRPVVFGDDRISLEVYQEVSSQEPNRTSEITSPIILNRSVTTEISLREGMTAVIGGLIQDNFSREQRGVPLLKDVPILGSAFRADAVSGGKVELLILITPYVVRDDDELSQAASSYSDAINDTLRARGVQTYTLLPWRAPWRNGITHAPRDTKPVGNTP
jgi:general secretion pathway protein D